MTKRARRQRSQGNSSAPNEHSLAQIFLPGRGLHCVGNQELGRCQLRNCFPKGQPDCESPALLPLWRTWSQGPLAKPSRKTPCRGLLPRPSALCCATHIRVIPKQYIGTNIDNICPTTTLMLDSEFFSSAMSARSRKRRLEGFYAIGSDLPVQRCSLWTIPGVNPVDSLRYRLTSLLCLPARLSTRWGKRQRRATGITQ